MRVHMWCHTVLYVENFTSSHGNINLYVTKYGHIALWNSLYDARLSHGASDTSNNIVSLVSA